jgi:hypothetical protein
MMTYVTESTVSPQYWAAVQAVIGSTNANTIAMALTNPATVAAVNAAWLVISGPTKARVSINER